MILFIKHIDIEGPGTLGDFFTGQGYVTKTIDLGAGDHLPDSLDGMEAVIILGGPMNVYEEDKYPFLKKEDIFIKEALARGIPLMGICLGSQLLAKAAGAAVGKSPQKEVGFFPIQLTQEGRRDPLFRGLNKELEIFQWHEDMFQIPAGAQWLAASSACPHQALKVGPNAYGLQFHIEITDRSIREWSDGYWDRKDTAAMVKKREMLEDYQKKKEQFNRVADKIYNNFLAIVKSQGHKVTRSQVTL